MKQFEKQLNGIGMRREWESILKVGSGDRFWKKQEKGELDNICKRGIELREDFIMFRMGKSFYKLLRRFDDFRKVLMGKVIQL